MDNANKRETLSEEEFSQLIYRFGSFSLVAENFQEGFLEFKKNLKSTPFDIERIGIMTIGENKYLEDINDKDSPRFKIGEGLAGICAQQKTPIFVPDVNKDKRYIDLTGEKVGMVCYPLKKEVDGVCGVLTITTKTRNFTKRDKDFFNFIAKKVNRGLINYLLYKELLRERNEHRVLNVTLQTLASDLVFEEKIAKVMRSVGGFLGTKSAILTLVSELSEGTLYTPISELGSIANTRLTIFELHKNNILEDLYKKNQKEITEILYIERKEFESAKIFNEIQFEENLIAIYPIVDEGKIIAFILFERDIPLQSKGKDTPLGSLDFLDVISDSIKLQLRTWKTSMSIIEEKERWHTIFNNVEDGIIIIDKDLKIFEMNPAMKKILKIKKEKSTNLDLRQILDIVSPRVNIFSHFIDTENLFEEDIKSLQENDLIRDIKYFFKTGKKSTDKQYILDSKSGRMWIEVNLKKLQDQTHKNLGVLNIRDITKDKIFEQEKNEFISIVSHELRTPLSAMKGFLSMIINGDYGKLNPNQVKFLEKIECSNERMVGLVEDLLDATRIDMGRITLIREPVDINELLGNLVTDSNTSAKTKNIKLNLHIETKKKKIQRDKLYVLADKPRLLQIFQNLIDNAIKYSFPSSTVDLIASESDQMAVIQIKDEGVGISEEDQKNLFQKFTRIKNPLTTIAGGTGLGLYITNKLVLAHNGTITVSQNKDKGTIFTVRLPLAKQLSLI